MGGVAQDADLVAAGGTAVRTAQARHPADSKCLPASRSPQRLGMIVPMDRPNQERVAGLQSRRRVLLSLSLALVPITAVVLVAVMRGGSVEPESAPPTRASCSNGHLILISIDALRADHLGVYGYPRNTSPRIDQLAGQGALFTQAGVQWPKTAPSVASFMTSTYCATNKVQQLRVRLDDRLITLAEVLRQAGFRTAAFIANVSIGPHFNFTQGFDEVHEMWDTSQGLRVKNFKTTFLPNDQIASRVVDWLRGNQGRRMFLWVHLLDPHGPYLPPDSLADRFVGDEIFARQPHPPPPAWVPTYQRVAHLRTVADFVAAYDAEIVSSDAAVGTILDEIDALGLSNRSLVVVTSDHGESLGEHHYYFNHGNYAYQACTRVPLILRYPPGIPRGLRIETPFPLLDLVPTVLDFLEVENTEAVRQFQGLSWKAVFAGKSVPSRPIITQSRDGQLAVRSGRWKFIQDPRLSTAVVPVAAREQLYDLQADPMETHNLLAKHPRIAGELRASLERWAQSIRDQESAFDGKQVPDQSLHEDTLEQLRSLGYVDDTGDDDRLP